MGKLTFIAIGTNTVCFSVNLDWSVSVFSLYYLLKTKYTDVSPDLFY